SINAIIIILIMYFSLEDINNTTLNVPFLKKAIPFLKIAYIILVYLTIIGTSNAVNLTDGLDGLVIVPIIFITFSLTVLSWITSDKVYLHNFNIQYLKNANELVIFCTSIIGSCLGFLWFNCHPAQIFMGDTGSLALGGTLGMISALLHQELLLIIIGGFLVIETLSVIFQILFIKLIGKKLFLMAPIHHHFELKQQKEPKIIVRSWIISFILLVIGLITLKVY
ncbi:phospho-N-acetylmuramoyl-pentapeptide-transferase, partial [Buchnera aphidicola (Hormaphis cornu)]